MDQTELITYLDDYLRISEIADYGPQGLQVEAAAHDLRRIALAVDTAPPVIKAAAAWGADMLLVHHGVLWRSVERISGPLGVRVRLLLAHDMHLYAAHLALDAHPQVGNNAVLARLLGLETTGEWCEVMGTTIGILARTEQPLAALTGRVEEALGTRPHFLAHGPDTVRTVAILSGFGADQVAAAQALGADTLLTGETSHANYYAAADYGLNVIFGGHYATETVGVQALGEHLHQAFGLDVQFFDFPTQM